MKQAATRQLFEYWDDLRGERLSPERGEIDPAAIRGILADTFILEVDEARRYPFRLAGTRFNALFLQDLKGRSFQSLWAERDRSEIASLLAHVCDQAAAIVAGVVAAPSKRPPIELELLLLPVRHLGKTHARILGSLTPARLENWIGLLPVDGLNLAALRVLRQARQGRSGPAGTSADVPASMLSTHEGGLAPRSGKVTRHGHLWMHHSDR